MRRLAFGSHETFIGMHFGMAQVQGMAVSAYVRQIKTVAWLEKAASLSAPYFNFSIVVVMMDRMAD